MTAKMCLSWILFGVALSPAAQNLQVGGPVSGLVYDEPSQALRQILGVPGAARIGAEALSGIAWASVAPNGKTAIVQLNGETRLFTSTDGSLDVQGTAIAAVAGSPQYAAWASDSSAVVLYSAVSRSVQWIHVQDRSATADTPVALTGVDGKVTSLAADQASGLIAVAVAGSGVYRLSASSGTVLLAPVADASAIAVASGGQTMWVADRTNAQLLELSNLESGAAAQALLTSKEQLAGVSAIGVSPDGRQLYLASRSTMQMYRFDRQAAAIADTIELAAPATAMTPLGRPSVLLLGQRTQSSDPLYLLIVDDSAAPALFFIPNGEGK